MDPRTTERSRIIRQRPVEKIRRFLSETKLSSVPRCGHGHSTAIQDFPYSSPDALRSKWFLDIHQLAVKHTMPHD